MKKSSRQKNRKQKQGQSKQQPSQHPQPKHEREIKVDAQQVHAYDGIDTTPSNPATAAEPKATEAEHDTSVNGVAPLNLTVVTEQKADLSARNQQRTQWKQQVKAGKMAAARVPKRFNRGG